MRGPDAQHQLGDIVFAEAPEAGRQGGDLRVGAGHGLAVRRDVNVPRSPCLCGTVSIPLVSIMVGARFMSEVSIRQVKAARALLGWSQGELAAASGVSHPTVKRLEAADGMIGGREETSAKLQAALEAAGVDFIPENGGGAGVRLKRP